VHLVIDAANVVGSRPDGWWRDRAGAAARLVEQVSAALVNGALSGPVTVVLEGAARAGVAEGAAQTPGLDVVHAPRDGDSAIVALVGSLVAQAAGGAPCRAPVGVVTADRGLRELVTAAGATVHGPSWLLEKL
jgi:hypothetical protein